MRKRAAPNGRLSSFQVAGCGVEAFTRCSDLDEQIEVSGSVRQACVATSGKCDAEHIKKLFHKENFRTRSL
ncbi:hypothetical protein [Acuticoccus kandeliae]|uniref:hypothetical protein n=1 Tax=Acuticoccus kandeliae TaxID=2073160 RepID=UPI000D3E749D|nr:hypothetical protein [Acuticoccus kandeliae]